MRNVILLTCLTGCVSGALPSETVDASADLALGKDGKPPLGIYTIDVAPATGSCRPPTVTGPLPHQLQVYGGLDAHGAMSVTTPFVTPMGWLSSLEMMKVTQSGWQARPESCGAEHGIDIAVVGASDTEYVATRTDTWSSTAAADRSGFCVGQVPANDCRSTAEMRYSLAEACPPPNCMVKTSPITDLSQWPTLTCVCGGDGGAP